MRFDQQMPPSLIRGRRRAASVLVPCVLLAWLSLCIVSAPACAQTPEIVVTDVFVDDRSDVDAAFLADGGRDLAARSSAELVDLLAKNAGWRVHPDFMADPAKNVGALSQAGERVYARGIITRADARQDLLFGGLQEWLFTIGLRLEFFDIRSGQIWFGQDVNVRAPLDAASEPDRATRLQQYKAALSAALATAAKRAGDNYRPGTLEVVGTAWTTDSLLVLDRGSRHGLGVGATGELAVGDKRWLLRLQEVDTDWSLAQVVAGNAKDAPPLKSVVRFSGINGLLARTGPQLAVAGAALPSASEMDEWFDVDPATLGQWLHDALVDSRAFNLLPPLLSNASNGGSELAAAFFRAQTVFSAAGDVKQDEIVGHRALPQCLVRLVVTHANLQRSTRLGYEALIPRLGLLLEIYDRRTHEVLLSQVHEGEALEKYSEEYRRLDLKAVWRELAQRSLRELSAKAAASWKPAGKDCAVTRVDAAGLMQFSGEASPGQRGELLREGEVIQDRDGKRIGRRARQYGVAEVVTAGPQAAARLALGDGRTQPIAGDLLRLPGKGRQESAQIRSVQLSGKSLEAEWRPDSIRTIMWAHQALGQSGRFNPLAPEILAAEIAAAEVALAGGEFNAVNLDEILLNDSPRAQILVDVRIGLARIDTTRANAYKNELEFKTGVELSFFTAVGEPLPIFKDRANQPTHLLKTVQAQPVVQTLVNGRVVQGVQERDYPDQFDQSLKACFMDLGGKLAVGTPASP